MVLGGRMTQSPSDVDIIKDGHFTFLDFYVSTDGRPRMLFAITYRGKDGLLHEATCHDWRTREW